MKKLSIGQMARLNGVSEQALRLYDKEGLFSPLHRDAENGYRYYDIRQSAQLDMIQRMKALGMSLKDIKKQLKHFDPDMLKDILYRNLDEIDDRSRELMYQRKAIERTLESYEWYENAPPDGAIVLEYIPRRLTYMTDSGVNFYDYGIDRKNNTGLPAIISVRWWRRCPWICRKGACSSGSRYLSPCGEMHKKSP